MKCCIYHTQIKKNILPQIQFVRINIIAILDLIYKGGAQETKSPTFKGDTPKKK